MTLHTLEQLAAQTAEKIWKAIIMHRLTLPEDTDLDLKPLILTALQTATAQPAPTQGGDWAEAAAREFLDSCMIQPPWKNNVPVLAETIRRHAPQPLASVRGALRGAAASALGTAVAIVEAGDKPDSDDVADVANEMLKAITPLLGANEDRERLIPVMQNAAQYIWEREGDDSPLVFSVREELRRLIAAIGQQRADRRRRRPEIARGVVS